MTQEHKCGIMTLRVDANKVEFLCAGCTATVIERPFVVGVVEWEHFWGGEPARSPVTWTTTSKDPHGEAVRKHREHFDGS